ncbi:MULTISPECIES: hypothetical protein [Raineya]|uniref:Lipoprotein n=1 Tax=Raineya orbicola TaxID=2016530 RepID=A0A2N3IAV7_9BACT|nr:hypothetical protein [Raineya orbicola]PKQ67461.1 hypothetical protein Rain11_2014 [Raineya orbicola]
MKKLWLVLLCLACTIALFSCGSDSYAYRRKHGGYDSQTWIPKRHYPYWYNKKAR